MKIKIKNIFGENLDVLIEGNKNSERVLIFIHGFGSDKNEGFASFLDLSGYFKDDFLTIRFDLSGYGKSEGEEYEFQFHKAAGDVDSVIRYARKKYRGKELNIIAHSLGAFVVCILSPYMIRRTIFTSIPNSNSKFIIRELQKRIKAKGGKINENGLSVYPRTSGVVQLIGKDFWKTLRSFDPVESIKELSEKTELAIFKPKQDEVLRDKYFNEYKTIKNMKYVEIDGDHNFTKKEDRLNLFENISKFLL
ncbi:MAG: alpha/beta fold hydrolase [Candidatus Paceibacterota bacterium]|jgi:pimeloyl-ACP methyl ester carboxylesterase